MSKIYMKNSWLDNGAVENPLVDSLLLLKVDITTSELGKDGYTSFAIRKSNLDGDNGIVVWE